MPIPHVAGDIQEGSPEIKVSPSTRQMHRQEQGLVIIWAPTGSLVQDILEQGVLEVEDIRVEDPPIILAPPGILADLEHIRVRQHRMA